MRFVDVFRWTAIVAATLAASSTPALADTVVFVDGTHVRGAATSAFELEGLVPHGYDVDIVPYPAQTWPISGTDSYTAGYSARVGVDLLHQRVPTAPGCVLVVGGSLDAMTIDQYLSNLPTDTPVPERLSFAVLGDPYRGGILAGIPAGTYIPVLDITKPAIVDTPYDVTVVQNQYDGIGDFPDQPGNWISVVNAILGALIYHNGPAYQDAAIQAQSGNLMPVSVEVNPLGGVTTTYVVPRALPITVLLKQLGLPASVADELDKVLKPMVEAGYSRPDPAATELSARPVSTASPNLNAVSSGPTAITRTAKGRLLHSPGAQRSSAVGSRPAATRPPTQMPSGTGARMELRQSSATGGGAPKVGAARIP